MKRSLTMMDNFMSKAFHHIQTPLHVMLTTGDSVHEKNHKCVYVIGPYSCNRMCQYLTRVYQHINGTLLVVENTIELFRYEQRVVCDTQKTIFEVKELAESILRKRHSLWSVTNGSGQMWYLILCILKAGSLGDSKCL